MTNLTITDWPSVSVIVVNYNGRRHLEHCLPSLMALEYPSEKLEILIADNGSSDDSLTFVTTHFSRVKILAGKQNRGFAAGNNWAAQSAGGEYLAFLNNDMRVDPSWLKELVSALDLGAGAICTSGRILSWDGRRIDFNGGYLNFYGMAFQENYGESEAGHSNYLNRDILYPCGGSMLIDRQIFLNTGGFDEDYFAYFEDVDLGWRLWVLGYRVVFSPQAVSYHRYQGTSRQLPEERRTVLYERNALFSIIKNYNDTNLSLILPVALLLTAHRGFLATQEDRAGYLMPAQGGTPLDSSSPQVLDAKKRPFPSRNVAYYWRKSVQIWSQKGLREFLANLFSKTAQWLQPSIQKDILSQPPDFSMAIVPRGSLSYLVALEEVARNLPQVWQKRAVIQSNRQRTDEEILSLFITPFHPHPPTEDFSSIQEELAVSLGLRLLFPPGDIERRAFDLPF